MIINPIKLSDCITLAKGKPPKEIPYFGLGAEPYLNPEYLRGNAQVEYARGAINSVRVFDGETVLLWDGSNAGEVFRGRKGLLASTMSRVKHGEEFDSNYFYYAVKHFEPYLKGQTSGSGIPHVDKEIFGKIELLVFPTDEQKQIAKILSTLDQAIEQTEAIIAKQQHIKTGLMQDLLTKGIDENGNIRSETTYEFKDSSLGRIPVEWDVINLKNLSIGGAQNGFFKKPELVGSGFKLINVSEIYQSFGINTNDYSVERVNAKANDLLRYGVAEGDLFFTRSSLVLEGIAHCNIIQFINEPTLFECHVIRIKPDKTKIVPEFLALQCRSHPARLFLMSRAKHVTMTTISQPELEELNVLVPASFAEQQAIVDVVLLSDRAIKRNEQQRNKLNRIKLGLMHDLLTGKVRFTDTQNSTLTPGSL